MPTPIRARVRLSSPLTPDSSPLRTSAGTGAAERGSERGLAAGPTIHHAARARAWRWLASSTHREEWKRLVTSMLHRRARRPVRRAHPAVQDAIHSIPSWWLEVGVYPAFGAQVRRAARRHERANLVRECGVLARLRSIVGAWHAGQTLNEHLSARSVDQQDIWVSCGTSSTCATEARRPSSAGSDESRRRSG